MTPEALLIWQMICFDLLLMQADIRERQRHTPGTTTA